MAGRPAQIGGWRSFAGVPLRADVDLRGGCSADYGVWNGRGADGKLQLGNNRVLRGSGGTGRGSRALTGQFPEQRQPSAGAGFAGRCAVVPDRAADGVALDSGRHQDGGGDQRRYCHDRRLDRCRRFRTTDPDRHTPRRHIDDSPGRRHPGRALGPVRPGGV